LGCFEFLLQNLLCMTDCMLSMMRLVDFFCCFQWDNVCLSPHVKNSTVDLYWYFTALYIFVYNLIKIVRIWASWYDKPFNMEDIVDKFILLLYANVLLMVVLELFWILVAKFTVYDRLYVVYDEASWFFLLLSVR